MKTNSTLEAVFCVTWDSDYEFLNSAVGKGRALEGNLYGVLFSPTLAR